MKGGPGTWERADSEVLSVAITYPCEMVWIKRRVLSLSSVAKLHASVGTASLALFY